MKKCLDCSQPAEAGRARCRKHLDLSRARTRAWGERNRERLAEISRDWYRQNKSKVNVRNVLSRYGLSACAYTRMRIEQMDLCAICGQPETVRGNHGEVKRLSVDHCHETGRIRGLLCNNCNRGIGLLGDSAERFARVLRYLQVSA